MKAKSFQVGDRVKILNPPPKSHRFGYIERIDGAYHYVRCERNPDALFELYPGEMELVRRYTCRSLTVGQNVRLIAPEKLDWGKTRPRLGGVVMGFNRGKAVVYTIAGRGRSQIFLIAPSDLEKSDAPVKTPPAPRLCPHCGNDVRKKPAA